MEETYSVIIEYYSGKRKGHKITIEGIDQDDIMNILGEITQDQLANAEIMIERDGMMRLYEDYMFDHFTRSQEKSFEKN
ncbi:MAG: hypothetical protein WCI62_03105 [Erysipelotrichaceae bacterium]